MKHRKNKSEKHFTIDKLAFSKHEEKVKIHKFSQKNQYKIFSY
jgi:hypothetical protein